MDLNDFNTNYLNNLLDKVSKEQKSVFLPGDFNVNLLNYINHNPTNELLDSLASNSFAPYILQPTRLTSNSKTLIDNIFSNIISPEALSGNLISTISDHLPQFMIVPNVPRLTFLKEIGQTMIKKTLFLITFLLTGM